MNLPDKMNKEPFRYKFLSSIKTQFVKLFRFRDSKLVSILHIQLITCSFSFYGLILKIEQSNK